MEDLFTYSARGLSLDLIFNVILIFGIGLLLWSLSMLKNIRKRAYEFEKRYIALSSILESSNNYWCMWDLEKNNITLSPNLSLAWGIDPEKILTSEDFIQFFGESGQSALRDVFKQLKEKTTSVELILQISNDEKYYKIFGGKQNKNLVTLWLLDVSHETQERHHNNLKINSLLEERQRLRSILDTIPYPVWYRDNSGRVTYNNSSYNYVMESLSDHMEEREQTLWAHMGITDEDVPNLFPIDQALRRHCVVEGRRSLLEFHEEPMNQDRVGYAIDLTAAELAERELRRHIQAHKEVLENLSVGITIYNAEKRMVFFNHAYARMYEFDETFLHSQPSVGEVLENLRARSLIAEQGNFPEFKKKIYQQFTSLISSFQELSYLPDGRTIRIITAPHPLGGIFYIFENVTDAFNLERQYNMQIAVQKETLNSLHEGVAVFGSDMRLKLINQEFTHVWKVNFKDFKEGILLSEVLDIGKENIILKQSWEKFKTRILTLVSERTPRSLSLRLTDNRILDCTYLPLLDGDHLFSVIDVTDRHFAEQALRDRNETLRFTDEVKTKFLQDVSLLLSRPLQKIVGYSEILYRHYHGALTSEQKRYVNMIQGTSKNLSMIVEEILELSNLDLELDMLVQEAIDLREFIQSVLNPLQEIINSARIILKPLSLKIVGSVRFDIAKMKRALVRILMQIIHGLKAGDSIQVSVLNKSKGLGSIFLQFPKRDNILLNDQDFNLSSRNSLPILRRIVLLNGGELQTEVGEKDFTISMSFPISQDDKTFKRRKSPKMKQIA